MKLFTRAAIYILAVSLIAATPPPATDAALAQTIANTMQNAKIPGAQVVIVDHGQVILNQGYGTRNTATQSPVDAHTRFEIGSITKQFTAAAVLQLKEQGKLALSDRLAKYVPQYARARDITIEQLLWQVSGIPNYTNVSHFFELATSKPGTFAAMLDLIKNKPLEFKPGTKWEYSNTNYVLLGRIVEIASGIPWNTYIRTHIFAPAQMTESTFMEDEAHAGDMASGYYIKKGTLVQSPPFGGWAYAAGAIVSTANDLAKWDAALFGGKLISAADLKLMTTPGRLNDGKATDYGFGWVIDTQNGQQRVWHNGGTFGFGSVNEIFPGLDQRIIVLENNANAPPSAIAKQALLSLHPELAAIEKKAEPGEDPAVTARAKALWSQFQTGTLDRSQFTAKMNTALTPELVAGAKAQFAQLGMPPSWIYRGKKVREGETTYAYHVIFSSGLALNVYMSVTPDDKIDGYLASPN